MNRLAPGFSAQIALGLMAMVAPFIFPGCGDSGDDGDAGTVTVLMDHEVNGHPLVLNEARYTNAAGNNYSISRLEYIVTDFRLERENGASVELKDHHYVNPEDVSTQEFTGTGIASGSYTALSFTFGIPGKDNVTGSLPNEMKYNNMAWPQPMGGGYHYMKMEGSYSAGDEEGSFLVHTGPSRGGDYSFSAALPLAFEIDGGDWEIRIVMDVDEWFKNPNVYDFAGRGMIMGNQDAQTILLANGDSVFSLGYTRRN
jgi:hypothetical protein